MSDSIEDTGDETAVERPNATEGRMFGVAIVLYVVGLAGLHVGAHFNFEGLVTTSLVPVVIAVCILLAYHGRHH